MGSDPNSHFLYLWCKGQTELGLASLGYSETIIFRPGMITDRAGPPKLGETILK